MFRDLEEEKNKYKSETNSKHKLLDQIKLLSDDNFDLKKQNEGLFHEISSLQQDLRSSKDGENKILYELDSLTSEVSVKSKELERISGIYNEFIVQYTRLLEENKIYKQSIYELEEKNKRLFENLEKELKARAHDYKERTLTMLNTPFFEREQRRSISPIQPSPIKNEPKKAEILSRTKLSEKTQTKLGNTAAWLLSRMENDSVLSNLRISSPSRKSPERPTPYNSAFKEKNILKPKFMDCKN